MSLLSRYEPARRVHIIPSLLTIGNFACGVLSVILCLNALLFSTRAQLLSGDDPSSPSVTYSVRSADSPPPGPAMKRYLEADAARAQAGFIIFWACMAVFFGMFFDMLDGRVARMTGCESRFGAELDSLADVVTFGVAPAVIVTTLWMRDMTMGKSWWGQVTFFGVIYAACAALRLARYNVESGSSDKNFFHGLPSPAAAGCVVTAVLAAEGGYRFLDRIWANAAAAFNTVMDKVGFQTLTAQEMKIRILAIHLVIIGLLMITRVPFVHVANRYLVGRRSFTILVAAVLLMAVFWQEPKLVAFLLFNGYALIGILTALSRRWRRRSTAADAPGGTHTQQ